MMSTHPQRFWAGVGKERYTLENRQPAGVM